MSNEGKPNLFMFAATQKELSLGNSMMEYKDQLWRSKQGFYSWLSHLLAVWP